MEISKGTFLKQFSQLAQNAKLNNYSYNDITMNEVSEMAANQKQSENIRGFRTNLTALTWAHAVNNQKKLTDALDSKFDICNLKNN